VGTFTAPIIERVRVTLVAVLETIFERKSPETLTSTDVVGAFDTTFSSPGEETRAPQYTRAVAACNGNMAVALDALL